MGQFVVRVPDPLTGEVDRLVSEGVVESRSDAVRVALESLVDRHRRRAVGLAIADGYARAPQSNDEMAWADEAARRMIEEEPW